MYRDPRAFVAGPLFQKPGPWKRSATKNAGGNSSARSEKVDCLVVAHRLRGEIPVSFPCRENPDVIETGDGDDIAGAQSGLTPA